VRGVIRLVVGQLTGVDDQVLVPSRILGAVHAGPVA
jgi:hypothetical protein